MRFTAEVFEKRLSSQLPPFASAVSGSGAGRGLDDLLEISDEREFLQAAYWTILGREADFAGLTGYTDALHRGVPRREILQRLAESDEAKAKPSGTPRTSPARPGRLEGLKRRVMNAAYGILKRVLLSRFDAIDYKLTLLFEELSSRLDGLSQKNDNQSALLSGRLEELEERVEKALADSAEIVRRSGIRYANVDGFIIGVPADEWRMAAFLQFRGVMEPGLTRLFKRLVRPGMVVVDAGANVGLYTLLAARLLEYNGRVHSFEPTPSTFALLQENIQANGFLESGCAGLHPVALADTEGTASLAVFAGNCGHNTLCWTNELAQSVTVPVSRLDTVLEAESRVDIVKIDVEGAEPGVLRGMARIIEKNPGIRILLEFSPKQLAQAAVEPKEFLDMIEAMGLEISVVDDQTGELRKTPPAELLSVFTANLHLCRRGAPEAAAV